MKKISKYFLIVTTFVMANVPAFAEENKAVCDLINNLKPIINVLRTLACVGAAFVLMDWAWGYIKSGDVKKDDFIVKHLIIDKDYDIIIIVNKKVVKINTSDLRELSRSAIGVKGVELKENEYVVDLILEEQE